jgi:hypothetical protein
MSILINCIRGYLVGGDFALNLKENNMEKVNLKKSWELWEQQSTENIYDFYKNYYNLTDEEMADNGIAKLQYKFFWNEMTITQKIVGIVLMPPFIFWKLYLRIFDKDVRAENKKHYAEYKLKKEKRRAKQMAEDYPDGYPGMLVAWAFKIFLDFPVWLISQGLVVLYVVIAWFVLQYSFLLMTKPADYDYEVYKSMSYLPNYMYPEKYTPNLNFVRLYLKQEKLNKKKINQ